MSAWQVYILRCADGTFYTGITTDTDKRITAHNAGKGAKYTAARRPVVLAYCEASENRSTATKREMAIKSLSRAEKAVIVNAYKANL